MLVGLIFPHHANAKNPNPLPDAKTRWIDELAMCESSQRPYIKHLDSNGKYSYGFVQFQLDTWLSYGKSYGTTSSNIYDKDLQVKVAQSMLDRGESYHWKNCVRKTTKKLGTYPV